MISGIDPQSVKRNPRALRPIDSTVFFDKSSIYDKQISSFEIKTTELNTSNPKSIPISTPQRPMPRIKEKTAFLMHPDDSASSEEMQDINFSTHFKLTFIIVCCAYKLVFCYFLINTSNLHQTKTRVLFLIDLLCYKGIFEFIKTQYALTANMFAFTVFYVFLVGFQIGFHLAISVYIFQKSEDVKDLTVRETIKVGYVTYTVLLSLFIIFSLLFAEIDRKLSVNIER